MELVEEKECKNSRDAMDEDYDCCVMIWFIGNVFEAWQKSIPQLSRTHFRCYCLLRIRVSGVALQCMAVATAMAMATNGTCTEHPGSFL